MIPSKQDDDIHNGANKSSNPAKFPEDDKGPGETSIQNTTPGLDDEDRINDGAVMPTKDHQDKYPKQNPLLCLRPVNAQSTFDPKNTVLTGVVTLT
jgi:hypothetical protein